MKDAIRYLKDYISLLESQIPNREECYKNYVDKKTSIIKEQIKKLEQMEEV